MSMLPVLDLPDVLDSVQGEVLLRKILATFLFKMKLFFLLAYIREMYILPLFTTKESEGQKIGASGNAVLGNWS